MDLKNIRKGQTLGLVDPLPDTHQWLLVTVTEVHPMRINFWVINGHWEGIFSKRGRLYVRHPRGGVWTHQFGWTLGYQWPLPYGMTDYNAAIHWMDKFYRGWWFRKMCMLILVRYTHLRAHAPKTRLGRSLNAFRKAWQDQNYEYQSHDDTPY